jgi:diguanylate cyclase (GGDEF)-like protein
LAAQASAALANALRYEEGRAFEERLAHQATHDALTGLPNRALLRDRARAAVARSRRDETLVAVMFVDLDRFKEVNDVLGHAVGDGLLKRVAERVVKHLRPEDTCARVGGDEFVVVAADQPDEHAVLDLAHRLLAAIHEPFLIDGVSVDTEASIGVAWAPGHGEDVDDLLRCADVAMYAAKNRQEGVVVYQSSDDQLTPVHLATLGDLRRALDSAGQLVPLFQPIIDLASDRLVGVEALVRWNHPSRGLVVPDDFIPLAERTAVIHQITDHVLDKALSCLNDWLRQGLDIRLAVNLSARTLLDVSLSQRLESLLSHHGVAPDRLRLEITESTLVADPTRAIATMHRLNDLGVRLSIDDFGTGYSSMSYLKSLPVDEIKIDRSFVTDMVRSPQDGAMVRSVIDLAHTLRLRVVAEGVEDGPTLDALAFIGCDLAQGFHVARPMPADALVSWAAEHHRLGTRREPDLVAGLQQV